jgi:hypothetical protein
MQQMTREDTEASTLAARTFRTLSPYGYAATVDRQGGINCHLHVVR